MRLSKGSLEYLKLFSLSQRNIKLIKLVWYVKLHKKHCQINGDEIDCIIELLRLYLWVNVNYIHFRNYVKFLKFWYILVNDNVIILVIILNCMSQQ